MTFTARYDPRRVWPGLAVSGGLLLIGVVAALAGVVIGWVLVAFMVWSMGTLARRALRREPVVTIDTAGVTDQRTGGHMPWTALDSMRTVDRRVGFWKVPLLELRPREVLDKRAGLAAAVLRGDIAMADARDTARLMVDLRHLDATPEQVLAAARAHRPAPAG